MTSTVLIVLLGCVALAHARMILPEKGGECYQSEDCGNTQGRSLCVDGLCRRDIPCNKRSDCVTWGGREASCYYFKGIEMPPGYGTCLLKKFADGAEEFR